MSKTILKMVLVAAGLVVTLLGVNIGFGGIATLGLQGASDFFSVTDQSAFGIRDNHVRFAGGVIIAIGLIVSGSAFFLDKAVTVLCTIALLFFIGGLARLSVFDSALILSADILPSLLIELIGFPALAYWAICETRSETAIMQHQNS